MNFWEGVGLAMGQIRSQKLKSFFSVLGVIIGVMFLITVVSIVEGMDQYVREDLSSEIFGINTVTVQRIGDNEGNLTDEERRARRRRPRLNLDDANALKERLTTPAVITVQVDNGGTVANVEGLELENVELVGGDAPIFDVRGWVVERGRPFTEQEAQRGASVVVLGYDVAETLFPDDDPLGQRVQIDGYGFRVIGVIEELGSVLAQSRDNRAVAPFNSAMGRIVSSRGWLEEIIIQTATPELVSVAQTEAEGLMRVHRRLRPGEGNNFAVETAEESLGFWDTISRILFVAFPTLVAISLIVGGIVIMNIMLVSVMERTREIGVRKALGARQRDILSQVLIESATLSFVGAAIGVGIGVVLAGIVAAISPLPAAVAAQWIILAMVIGVTVGVVAGVYPASRAAKLDPVDALRYE